MNRQQKDEIVSAWNKGNSIELIVNDKKGVPGEYVLYIKVIGIDGKDLIMKME
jgi:hypothetical protein